MAYREPAQRSLESRVDDLEFRLDLGMATWLRMRWAWMVGWFAVVASTGFLAGLGVGTTRCAPERETPLEPLPAAEQPPREHPVGPVPSELPARDEALEDALLSRLRYRGGRYVRHCREVNGGCEAHVQRSVQLFVEWGHHYDVDPYLLAAIAFRESGLDPGAIGGAGERGQMQIHPRSPAGLELSRRGCANAPSRAVAPRCASAEVELAAGLLAQGLDRCGADSRPRVREARALTWYNSGHCEPRGTGPRQAREPGPPPYARSVLRLRDALRGETS